MDLTTEGTEAAKVLKRVTALLDRIPRREVSADTADVYKDTMKRMASESFDPFRPGDARDTYNLRRAALHFCGRIMLEVELVKLDRAKVSSDTREAELCVATLAFTLAWLEPAINRDPPLEPATSSFACPESRWAAQEKPPRRGKASKKHVLFKLPPDWMHMVWAAAGPDWKYRDALAIHMLAPVRPAEFIPGLREGRHVPGIAVRLEDGVLIINVAPVKSHGGKYGTGESVIRFDAASGHPAIVHLVAFCRSSGGRAIISLEDTNAMRKAVARLGRKALGPAVVITPYVFRSQVIADLKKTAGAGVVVAAAAGHCTDRTQSHYGRVECGRRRPDFISATALRAPVAKNGEYLREFAAARGASPAPAMG